MLLGAALTAALVGPVSQSSALADASAPSGTPTATGSNGLAVVGPLFTSGLGRDHDCTATVVDSPHGDLLLTAAHCVQGTGAGMQFAPGYLGGRTPYGVWTVTHAWAPPSWLSRQDPQNDFAVLQVGGQQGGSSTSSLESVTGGLPVGQVSQTRAPRTATVLAYATGRNDSPVSCTTTLAADQGYPAFYCHGYPNGTSGSPFLWRNRQNASSLVGLIGGLHQGGCYEWSSYSSPFNDNVYRLLARATDNLPADTLPLSGTDGC